jgi:NagD protein
VLTELEEEPDAVVVGFDTGLTFERLCKAAWWIRRGKPYIGTHPDRVCPTDLPTVMVDCGSLLACLETATGRAPTAVLGKPSPRMLAGILQRHGLHPSELAMVGDRTYTDMAMAQAVGAVGVLVLTGETTLEEAHAYDPPPDLVLPSIRELGEMLAGRPPRTPPGPPLARGGEAGKAAIVQEAGETSAPHAMRVTHGTPDSPGKAVPRS